MQNITIYQPQTTTTQYIEMNRVNDTPTPNPIVVNTNIYIITKHIIAILLYIVSSQHTGTLLYPAYYL